MRSSLFFARSSLFLVRSSLFFTGFLAIAITGVSQKRTLSFEQIFHNAPTGLIRPLPDIIRWIDDDHYLQRKESDGGMESGGRKNSNGGMENDGRKNSNGGMENDGRKNSDGSDGRIGGKGRDKQTIFVVVDALTGAETPYRSPGTKIGIREEIPAGAVNVEHSPDGKWIAYTKANNLFAKELSTGKEIQYTHDGSANIYNGYAAYLYYEEILHKESHYRAFWWSPDSKHIAFIHFDETEVPVYAIFHSEGQHGFQEKQHYPQAGDKNPKVKMGIVPVDGPAIVWADFNENTDQYFHTPCWTPDGSSLWVQWMPRSQQELKFYAVDPQTGSKKEVYSEKQKTWLFEKYPTFLDNGRQYIIASDRTGWTHLYLYDMDGTLVNQITSGAYSVGGVVHIDEKSNLIYISARKENSARYDLYRIGFDGKGMTRLTFGDYTHDEISMSPHAKYFITTYSNLSTPPRMALMDSKGKLIRQLGDSKGPEYEHYELAKLELLRVRSRDNLFDLPVKITYPLHFDPSRRYPVLINVYGGPALGMVFDKWALELRPQWWAKEGLIQVTLDNRSSGHFGKTGMNSIYRQAGKPETEDHIDCARWLRRQSFVDTTRIGIYGYSFGGFMTCMALTYGADVFNYGIAYYPLIDWSLYDSYYSEKFMGTPKDNPEGYRSASPITYAKNYKGLLRIVQGDVDNNVHMQNTIQFIDTLEKLDRHFELMIYPGQRHGRGGWAPDQRTHSYNEDFKFIYEHLLNKPMPDLFWK